MTERASPWLTLGGMTEKGWPRSFPVVQFPNLPLIVGLLGSAVSSVSHGTLHAHATAVFYIGLAVWAGVEAGAGVNWVRRALGVGFLIYLIVRLGHALEG